MADSNSDRDVAVAGFGNYRSEIEGINMFCPRCQRQTTHADIGDNQVQCVVCQLEHDPTAPPYFDRQLAAAGERRDESEA